MLNAVADRAKENNATIEKRYQHVKASGILSWRSSFGEPAPPCSRRTAARPSLTGRGALSPSRRRRCCSAERGAGRSAEAAPSNAATTARVVYLSLMSLETIAK